jgi:hypothetical protein
VQGSEQIYVALATPGISWFILAIGMLDYNAVFTSDHIDFFFDTDADGFLAHQSRLAGQ